MKKINLIILTFLMFLTAIYPTQTNAVDNMLNEEKDIEIYYVTEEELEEILANQVAMIEPKCATCNTTTAEKIGTESKWIHFGIHPKYTGVWQYTEKWGLNATNKTTASLDVSVSIGGQYMSVSANFNISTVSSTVFSTSISADSSRASKPTYSCYAILTKYRMTERRNLDNSIVRVYYYVGTNVIEESIGVVYKT